MAVAPSTDVAIDNNVLAGPTAKPESDLLSLAKSPINLVNLKQELIGYMIRIRPLQFTMDLLLVFQFIIQAKGYHQIQRI